MTRGDRTVWCLAAAAAVLAVVGLWPAFDNPTVRTARGDDHPCYAPYDIVLNDVTVKGMPEDHQEVEAACRHAAERRFHLAVGSGAAAAVFGAVATVTIWRRS